VTDEQNREFGLFFGATDHARSLLETSAWFVRAVLGDERVRRALAESVAEALTPEQARLVDLIGTFHQMDARLGIPH
jgi:hypothetical protein